MMIILTSSNINDVYVLRPRSIPENTSKAAYFQRKVLKYSIALRCRPEFNFLSFAKVNCFPVFSLVRTRQAWT